MTSSMDGVKALTFDVFGTVVDWRGSIAREARALAQAKGLRLNAAKFADAWRSGYRPAMNRVGSGELPWTKIDDLHRMILDDVLVKFRVSALSEAEKADKSVTKIRTYLTIAAIAAVLTLAISLYQIGQQFASMLQNVQSLIVTLSGDSKAMTEKVTTLAADNKMLTDKAAEMKTRNDELAKRNDDLAKRIEEIGAQVQQQPQKAATPVRRERAKAVRRRPM